MGVIKSLKLFKLDSGVGLRVKKRAFKRGNSPALQSEVIFLAKDGTNRGGARIGAGAKKKPLADKIAEDNPGGRTLAVMKFSGAADLQQQAQPAWAKRLHRRQQISHAATTTAHTLRGGDGGGSSSGPSLHDSDS